MPIRILEVAEVPTANPEVLATECIEAGCDALLLDSDALPPEFFDLSTRVLGNLLHRMDLYRLRLAAVVPDLQHRSEPFRAFVRETNAGTRFRIFSNRSDAAAWLETLPVD